MVVLCVRSKHVENTGFIVFTLKHVETSCVLSCLRSPGPTAHASRLPGLLTQAEATTLRKQHRPHGPCVQVAGPTNPSRGEHTKANSTDPSRGEGRDSGGRGGVREKEKEEKEALRKKQNLNQGVRKNKSLRDRLGAVFWRSWVVWGASRGRCYLFLSGFRIFCDKPFLFEKQSFQEASRTQFGLPWSDLGAQSAPKSHPKTTPKQLKTQHEKSISK